MNDPDIDPVLSGHPGDPVHGAARENFSGQGLNAWLDTSAGQAMCAQFGGRAQAAAAMAEDERARRALRWDTATGRATVQAGRWPSIADAMIDTPDPVGGGGAQLSGSEQDIADAARRADPARPWFVVRGVPDATVRGVSQGAGTGPHAADTRPPWGRD